MNLDRKIASAESKRAALRHAPLNRRPGVHSDEAEPRPAAERTSPLRRDYESFTDEPRDSTSADVRAG